VAKIVKRQRKIVTYALPEAEVLSQANLWLTRQVGDRVFAETARATPDRRWWYVPVLLAYPGLVLGQVGELWLDGDTGEVVSHTDVDEMIKQVKRLYRHHHAEIKAAFLQTGAR
jgi:hypothetical protein